MTWYDSRPSGDIQGTDNVRTVFLTYINNDINASWSNFTELKAGTAQDFKGTYSSVGDRLEAMELDIQNAGTGTAKIRAGTNADRLALSSPSDGLVWVETDTRRQYVYDASAAEWYNTYPAALTVAAIVFGT